MKELVIVSGKGGTGKTSLTACLALLAERPVLADADVDAANLPLVLEAGIVRRERLTKKKKARILPGHCVACGKCEELCRFEAIRFDGPGNGRSARTFRVDPLACEGCGVCAHFCAGRAIAMEAPEAGRLFVSETRPGPLVHARLEPGAENSGKLVALVRGEAKRIAEAGRHPILLVDGPPGIGCPVIAAVTGASALLVVTEPTVSGAHDMERILALARHFSLPAAVCVNKWDLHPETADAVERRAVELGARPVGRVRYDRAVTLAQMRRLAVVEFDAPSAPDIRRMWSELLPLIPEKA